MTRFNALLLTLDFMSTSMGMSTISNRRKARYGNKIPPAMDIPGRATPKKPVKIMSQNVCFNKGFKELSFFIAILALCFFTVMSGIFRTFLSQAQNLQSFRRETVIPSNTQRESLHPLFRSRT
jgi:hypothetical protein